MSGSLRLPLSIAADADTGAVIFYNNSVYLKDSSGSFVRLAKFSDLAASVNTIYNASDTVTSNRTIYTKGKRFNILNQPNANINYSSLFLDSLYLKVEQISGNNSVVSRSWYGQLGGLGSTYGILHHSYNPSFTSTKHMGIFVLPDSVLIANMNGANTANYSNPLIRLTTSGIYFVNTAAATDTTSWKPLTANATGEIRSLSYWPASAGGGGGGGSSPAGNYGNVQLNRFGFAAAGSDSLNFSAGLVVKGKITATGYLGVGTSSSPSFGVDITNTSAAAGQTIAINTIPVLYKPYQATPGGSHWSSLFVGTGGRQETTGYYNVAVGDAALDSLTTGQFHVAIGANAGRGQRGGIRNVLIGTNAGLFGRWKSDVVAIGTDAVYYNKGGFIVAIGTSALANADTVETTNVIGAEGFINLKTGNQNNLMGYKGALNCKDAHFSNLIGYRVTYNSDSLNAVDALGHSAFHNVTKGEYLTGAGFWNGYSLTGGRASSYFGSYAGYNASQKVSPIHQTVIGAYAYGTRDYETVIGSDSTKYLRIKATDSLQVDLQRTTSYSWVYAYDSTTKNTRYMPVSSLSVGGGGSGVTTMAAIGSTPNANGATISGSTLNLEPASASYGGVVTTGTQTLAGAKTFSSNAVINGITVGTYGGDQGFQVTNSKSLYFVTNGTLLNFEAGSAKLLVQIAGAGAYTQNSIVYGGNTGYIRMGSNLKMLGSAGYTSLGSAGTEDQLVVNAGNVGIGTTSPSTYLDINGNKFRVRTAKTPSSASDTGSQGDICWDTDYIYICTATNTWKRVAVSTW